MQQQKPLEGAQLVIMTVRCHWRRIHAGAGTTIANVAIPLSPGIWA